MEYLRKNHNKPKERLEQWLKEAHLPEDAANCISNFVMTCEEPDQGDLDNFINQDIRDYPAAVQQKLMEGFSYTYLGEKRDIIILDEPEHGSN